MEFYYKNNLARKYFLKLGFPKAPELRLELQVLNLAHEKSFKNYISNLLGIGLPKTTKI